MWWAGSISHTQGGTWGTTAWETGLNNSLSRQQSREEIQLLYCPAPTANPGAAGEPRAPWRHLQEGEQSPSSEKGPRWSTRCSRPDTDQQCQDNIRRIQFLPSVCPVLASVTLQATLSLSYTHPTWFYQTWTSFSLLQQLQCTRIVSNSNQLAFFFPGT